MGGSSLVHVFGGTLTGGAAGDPTGTCPPASSLPPIAGPGTVVLHPGEPLALEATSPVREGETLQLDLEGAPGDLALVGLALAHGGELLPALSGALLLEPPLVVVPLGALPPGGTLQVPIPLPDLGPSVQGLVLHLQAASCAAGTCALGTATATLLLDAAF